MTENSAEQAVHRSRIAAEEAEQATLWDAAAQCYEAALSALPGTASASEEADLLTALGRCYWNLSDARMAWRTLRRAIALYRDRGDGAGMARATLEILRIWGPPDRQRAMAEEALAALGDSEPHMRARLLFRCEREDEALVIGRLHQLEDILVVEEERRAHVAFEAGLVDEANAALRHAHEVYSRFGHYHGASSVLRFAAFETMALGSLDRGMQLADETVQYSRAVHLKFTEQLALMDLAGVAFARCDFERCNQFVDERPTDTDFRGDLYRMWIAELRGDMPTALALIVDPERGGGATTALSQTHAAAAGVLHHASRTEAARAELETWAEIARRGNSFSEESPAVADCLVELGSNALVSELYDQLETRPAPVVYATLQGRGLAYVHGALALRLGAVDRAREVFAAGLAWSERERCPIDAGRCLQGLAAASETDRESLLRRAAEIFERHSASLYFDQVAVALSASP